MKMIDDCSFVSFGILKGIGPFHFGRDAIRLPNEKERKI